MRTESTRFDDVLRFAASRGICDVHFKPGCRPLYRRAGALIMRREEEALTDDQLIAAISSRLLPGQVARFEAGEALTFSHGLAGSGSFRLSVFRQRGRVAVSARVIPSRVATLRELKLPAVLGTLATAPSGLVLVCGGSGSGRSTTIAAMVEFINTSGTLTRHVVLLEEPIEAVFDDKLAWIDQREIGIDTPTLAESVRLAMRQHADVIVLAALSTFCDIELAVSAAEAGHLVIAGLHPSDVPGALRLLADRVPGDHRASFRQRLASVLIGISAQRLLQTADGKGLVPVVEVLRNNEQVWSLLAGDHDPMASVDVMDAGIAVGMQSLERSLSERLGASEITHDMALSHARRPQMLEQFRRGNTAALDSGGLF